MLEIKSYRRHFALYEGETLIAIIAYKKGAVAVKERIEALEQQLAEANSKLAKRDVA